MQQAPSAVDFKHRAFRALSLARIFEHCSLTQESIDFADEKHLGISVRADTMRGADEPSVLQRTIARIADLVSIAAASLGDSGKRCSSSTTTMGVEALATDVVEFRAEVAQEDGEDHVKYAATISRDKVNKVVIQGSRKILPRILPSTPAPPAGPSPQQPGASSPPPTSSSGKRPAPSSSAPPQPAKRASTSGAGPSRPPPPPPRIRTVSDSLWHDSGIRDHFQPMPHKYAYINCGARDPTDCKALKKRLASIGVAATRVSFSQLFLNFHPNYVFFFDVNSAEDERKVGEKLFKESEWTKVFSVAELSQNKPFLSLNMRVTEIFQSMLLATRFHGSDAPPPKRRDVVWSRREMRMSLQSKELMALVKEKLNNAGRNLLGMYRGI